MPIVKSCREHWRLWVLLVALALGIATGAAGLGTGPERILQDAAWRLRSHSASGTLHIVEIDARSISAIERWPWPRSNHAQLIDRLRTAGAASIAFDVDFSSHSSPQEDAALGAALARADGQVVLPTFRQNAGGGRAGWTDSLPIPQLRQHSVAAGVSILPEADGYIRRAPIGTVTGGLPRPSLSAMIAGRGGSAGNDFPIDFAIDPSSIPRHSFIDIRDGRFDPAQLAGKQVLVGATAVEMGDRYVVPVHGVLPGVVIQALAAETLMRSAPAEAGWLIGLIAAGLLCWWIVRARSRKALALLSAIAPLAIFSAAVAAQEAFDLYFAIMPALVAIAAASSATAGFRALSAARRRRLQDLETGLPNRAALEEELSGTNAAGLVAARIAEFDKFVSALGPGGTAELILRIRDRVAHLGVSTVYRIEDRVLCWRYADQAELEQRLADIRAAMLHPIEVHGRRVDVSLALGCAAIAADGADHTVANAALAAVRARTAGTAWYIHQAGDEEEVERELSLLSELDEAVAAEQLEVLYQPKLDILSGRITSVEALVRWHHPTRGFLRPDLFIPLAERSDRIAGLTLYVLRRAIKDIAGWHAAGHRVSAAINVSATLLVSPSFLADVRALIQHCAVDPRCLTFEVTETAAMSDPDAAVAALHSVKQLGVAISMDDYGTGQSTLSYLKQLPLDELKIDRSFVQHVHRNRGDAVLVRSTVDLAHELGVKVVAEGVEDAECLDYLRSIGCDMAQGYLISPAVPAGDLEELLGDRIASAA